MKSRDSYSTLQTLTVNGMSYRYFAFKKLPDAGSVRRLPFSLKILLENLLRHEDGVSVRKEDIESILRWKPAPGGEREISFMPARVLLQDFTGVPCAVDLAVMRDAMARMGGDPKKINPLLPVDLVIDHSVQVDEFGSPDAFLRNVRSEFARNNERYTFLRWTQQAFRNFRVVPPDTGIVHQVNLEYFANVVFSSVDQGERYAYPDTVVGTDSHTTMINGLGVLGWGVGGIEAEAAMLGQPISMLLPSVVGFKLTGTLPAGVTATDLVLTITQLLRKHGVVGKFVEFYGSGISSLSLADRATIANMAPEYGATMGFFPVDEETLAYLRFTHRDESVLRLVEAYTREQELFRTDATPDPLFTEYAELDLSGVEASIAGPRRPQDRVLLRNSKSSYRRSLVDLIESKGKKIDAGSVERWLSGDQTSREGDNDNPLTTSVPVQGPSGTMPLRNGAVVLAAITSCTNTSNPSVLIAAGLLAQKAVERGLQTKPWVKTSLAPGSKVVTAYLKEAGLLPYLEQLGFHLVGYGCTTCIGNSGPLPQPIAEAIQKHDLVVAAVLSGNRNFEGRINSHVRANYLASPPLVVAYAIAGSMDVDFTVDPLGNDQHGNKIYLKDIWPSPAEIAAATHRGLKPEMFAKEYANVFRGNEEWNKLPVPEGDSYRWEDRSTYIKAAPFFDAIQNHPALLKDILGARVLAVLGDSVTTDHISPAGSIPVASPAGQYLIAHGVDPKDFNSYGARRGNHEVMMRGTFANIRLKNLLAPGTEGGWTVHPSSKKPVCIYDASMLYAKTSTPLIILAGKEYGSGSSRDWAAKGSRLLGVRAVLAESFERIHRSNLVGMGVLPLQFQDGESRTSIGLSGFEIFDIHGIAENLVPRKVIKLTATADDGSTKEFSVICRIDTPMEVEYYINDGILQYVLRSLLHTQQKF